MIIDNFIEDIKKLGMTDLSNEIKNYVLIDIQNAADYFLMYNDDETVDSNSFSECFSPWNKFLLKFKFPPFSYSKECGKTIASFRPDIFIVGNTNRFSDENIMSLAYYCSTTSGKFIPLGCSIHRFNENSILKKEYFDNGESKIITVVDQTNSDHKEFSEMICSIHSKCALFAFTFCNCKNVINKINYYDKKLINKRARENKFPVTKYYTLEINNSYKNNKSEPKNIWNNSIHICRGHFKTFTQEKPLFGKVIGTYWWPMTVKGSEEVGIIKKDYKI